MPWFLATEATDMPGIRSHQLGLEFGAISATAAASLGELVVGVHVSTIYYVDTMVLDWRHHCQMGWPDAYDELGKFLANHFFMALMCWRRFL